MAESSQNRVGSVRPPRVDIRYEVEEGGATASRELPLVAGIIADLSGDTDDPVEYRRREFIEVEPGGVDPLMRRLAPELRLSVADRLSGEPDREIGLELRFRSIDDFSPAGLAAQIPATAKLLEHRRALADLYGKLESNERLDGILDEVLADPDMQERLRSELGEGQGEGEGQ